MKRRYYARRFPLGLPRCASLSVRLHEATRECLISLAEDRRMSLSEYVARLIQDHVSNHGPIQ